MGFPMTVERVINRNRLIGPILCDDIRRLAEDSATLAVAAYLASPETAEALLGSLSEDDLMYDHPVAMTGEPMDPVLFVRWDAILAAMRETVR